MIMSLKFTGPQPAARILATRAAAPYVLADLAEGEHLLLAEEVEDADAPHLATRLAVLAEGNLLRAVEESVGEARVRAAREDEVAGLQDLLGARRRGDDDGGDAAQAEGHASRQALAGSGAGGRQGDRAPQGDGWPVISWTVSTGGRARRRETTRQ